MRAAESEGFANVLGFRLYYRLFDPPSPRRVVLGLHGGPGAGHDYLLPLADLTQWGYRVVLFDQLGCGRSELPSDHGLFTLAQHVKETEGIRQGLGLGRVHVIGSSYGGLLALAYALQYPDSLASLVTVGGLASVPFAAREMARLKDELPEPERGILKRFEARGELAAPEYLRAVEAFYRRHLCRLDPWPREVRRSFERIAQQPVYAEMNGPNEFTITGTIRDIDLTPQLSAIRVPTLVTGGQYDEVTPNVAEQIRAGIPGARRVVFERSSHLPFWEERALFMETVGAFLRDVEGRASSSPPRSASAGSS